MSSISSLLFTGQNVVSRADGNRILQELQGLRLVKSKLRPPWHKGEKSIQINGPQINQ